METPEQALARLDALRPIIQQYASAIDSPAWQDVIMPILKERRILSLNRLVASCVKGESGEILRALGAEVATLNWALTNMTLFVERFHKDVAAIQQESAEEDRLAADAQRVVDSGRNNEFPDNPDYMEPPNV